MQTGQLEYPSDQEIDISHHAQEDEDYYAECIRIDKLNTRMKFLDETIANAETTTAGRANHKSKQKHKYGIDDDDSSAGQLLSDKGELITRGSDLYTKKDIEEMIEERAKLKDDAEKRKERVKTEKLARIAR